MVLILVVMFVNMVMDVMRPLLGRTLIEVPPLTRGSALAKCWWVMVTRAHASHCNHPNQKSCNHDLL